jgi:glycosyltransferase involved in cell wall biosynthesis
MKKVSVIIVTFKRLFYLQMAIDSVLQQGYENLEIIVVADGDQPDVKEFVGHHPDKRLQYFYVEHVGYPSVARNLGLEKASGDFIAFCDDDDIWLPNKLAAQLEVLEKENSALCFTNRLIINSSGDIENKEALRWLPKQFNVNTLLASNYITYSSVVLRKSILKQTGVFPEESIYKAVEDYHLWLRIAYFGKLSFLNQHLVLYRVHETNITFEPSIGLKKNAPCVEPNFWKLFV